jgi:hypothetical protein
MNTPSARFMTCLIAVPCLALLAAGCPGSLTTEEKQAFGGVLGDGGPGGSGPCDAPSTVFQTSCATTGCHNASSMMGALDLSVADPFPALKDKTGDPAGECSAQLLIDSANPENSLMYTKMFRSDDPQESAMFAGCGLPMPFPFGPEPGTESQRDCVLSWIKGKLGTSGTGGASGMGGGAGLGGGAGTGTGGAGGTGGTNAGGTGGGAAAECDAASDTELAKTGWMASGSPANAENPASGAIDEDPTTRWGSGEPQASGDYFQLDFGSTQAFDKVVLDCLGKEDPFYDDSPVGTYDFKVSTDGTTFNTVTVTGAKSNGVLTITANMCLSARAFRVELTQGVSGDAQTWFSVFDATVYK